MFFDLLSYTKLVLCIGTSTQHSRLVAVVGWHNADNLRPSHTTTETAKIAVFVHTHYNFFSQLQRFLQQFD